MLYHHHLHPQSLLRPALLAAAEGQAANPCPLRAEAELHQAALRESHKAKPTTESFVLSLAASAVVLPQLAGLAWEICAAT